MIKALLFLFFSTIIFASDLPDSNLTPGNAYPHVFLSDICKEWYKSSVPYISTSTKRKVFLRYGISMNRMSEYVIDHLIPIEIGGNNYLTNLWPQKIKSKYTPTMKRILGQKLHDLICNGKMNINDAQKEVANNWIETYNNYVNIPFKEGK